MKSKRLFSVLLAVFIILSLVPTMAFAGGAGGSSSINIGNGGAAINGGSNSGGGGGSNPVVYEITIESDKIEADKYEAEAGDVVTLTVTPDEGYIMSELLIKDGEENEIGYNLEEDGTYTFEMPENNVTISAAFEETPIKYTITEAEDIQNGAVTFDKEEAEKDETVTVTLSPDEGYEPDTISVIDSDEQEVEYTKITSKTYTFLMPEKDVTINASFKEKEAEHSIIVSDEIKKGNVDPNKEKAQQGQTVTISIEPYEGCMLDKITVTDADNNEIDTILKNSNTYTFLMPDLDVTIYAVFIDIPEYKITVDDDISHGSIKASRKNAAEGEKITITISANTNYTIKSVTVLDENDDEVSVSGSGSASRSFKMPASDVTVTATFKRVASDSGNSSSTTVKTTGTTVSVNSNTSNNNSESNNSSVSSKSLPFTDVAENDWFVEDVRFAYENNIMSGVAETAFAPYENTTRAMIVTILYRIEKEPTAFTNNLFSDVSSDDWYANAISWASGFGIVNGYSDSEFAPNANITREQFAAILYRYAQYKGYDISTDADISAYEDAESLSDWAMQPMKWAASKGFITGLSQTSLAPLGNATRAQASAILHRVMNAYK